MKALLIVTGRGLGGDASIALNTIKYLEKNGVECEIALDESAPGILFKKNGYSWHKISIPQAGGHAATKLSAAKGALKLLSAVFKARNLIKKLDVDFVIGVLGGGAIVGSVGAKLARKPAFSLISTPLDSKVCPKFNLSFLFPEIELYRQNTLPNNMVRSYYPLGENIGGGDSQIALEKLKEFPNFDENKKTILFSSGSSIFKGMIDGVKLATKLSEEYNEYPLSYTNAWWKQTANIDMSGIDWVPIGETYNNRFMGVYDGGEFEIHNLTIEYSGEAAGLFGIIGEGATIKNVILKDDCYIKSSSVAVGGIVGDVDISKEVTP